MSAKITLRNGKVLEPNGGVIGLNNGPDFQIHEGWDGAYQVFDPDDIYNPADILTIVEAIEVCDLMIARWQEYKRSLTESAQTSPRTADR
jgi:hypothetical protein